MENIHPGINWLQHRKFGFRTRQKTSFTYQETAVGRTTSDCRLTFSTCSEENRPRPT